jgi:hypothetical protein
MWHYTFISLLIGRYDNLFTWGNHKYDFWEWIHFHISLLKGKLMFYSTIHLHIVHVHVFLGTCIESLKSSIKISDFKVLKIRLPPAFLKKMSETSNGGRCTCLCILAFFLSSNSLISVSCGCFREGDTMICDMSRVLF